MEMNEILDRLPKHLLRLIVDQPFNEYTTQDHSVWRYVMRRNIDYLSKVAHESYLDGLEKAGINIEHIPNIYGMNRILKEIGWAAVAVDGFIPPAAFMEFQKYNVLVIAADIRPINQINYTPAPDIIHEAAGHAPIIADKEYAAYLREFGRIGHRAFSSALNYKIYESIRHLSILKADPYTQKNEIELAEFELSGLDNKNIILTEMSRIRNLHWWTVEYGLIGSLHNPKIYGAGLLSSIGESVHCLKSEVKKIPYTVAAADYRFDITTMQPQLFVSPDFETLNEVLDEFTNSMALRRGGLYGIWQAIESENVATAEYSSGLQVCGVLTELIEFAGKCAYIKTTGPTTLNFNEKLLTGHGKTSHQHGFGSPVGKLVNSETPLEIMHDHDLKKNGIEKGKTTQLTYQSGVKVNGNIKNILRKNGRVVLITFEDCMVTYKDQVLFHPNWGTYDMAVGEYIRSAFSGPVDPDAFGLELPVPKEKTHKIKHNETAKGLHRLYQEVRSIRESKNGFEKLHTLSREVINSYPTEWLLPLEILELCRKRNTQLAEKLYNHLDKLKSFSKEQDQLIENGLSLFPESHNTHY